MGTDEFGTVFVFCFPISLGEAGLNDQFHGAEPSGFNSQCKRAIRVQFPRHQEPSFVRIYDSHS